MFLSDCTRGIRNSRPNVTECINTPEKLSLREFAASLLRQTGCIQLLVTEFYMQVLTTEELGVNHHQIIDEGCHLYHPIRRGVKPMKPMKMAEESRSDLIERLLRRETAKPQRFTHCQKGSILFSDVYLACAIATRFH